MIQQRNLRSAARSTRKVKQQPATKALPVNKIATERPVYRYATDGEWHHFYKFWPARNFVVKVSYMDFDPADYMQDKLRAATYSGGRATLMEVQDPSAMNVSRFVKSGEKISASAFNEQYKAAFARIKAGLTPGKKPASKAAKPIGKRSAAK